MRPHLPYLLSILPALLLLLATILIVPHLGVTGKLTIDKELAFQIVGYGTSIFVGLVGWLAHLLIASSEEKRDYRRAQILRWREAIHKDFEQLEFCDTVVFSEVRPHLSRDTLDSIQGSKLTVRIGRGGNLIKSLVLDDIANLEKQWSLI